MESKEAAKRFRECWLLSTDSEVGGYQKYWISLLGDVLAAYGLPPDTPEPEIVSHLMLRYQWLTAKEG